jgi:mannosylglycerate hydrolase
VTRVFLVPHTHWDREWYRPFQSFRISLVDVVDEVLDLLESDERMRFTLDGQLATVDDYLAIRPEGAERIRRLVQKGRLAIGPWQTLVDEFLVSGETIVRNLERGLARAAELGGAMRVGYLPDSFGHIAQMPQILRRAGIERAVVWRGVPSAIDAHAFVWEAPDGSAVLAEYLPDGYGNAAYVFNVADADLSPLVEREARWFGDDPVLGMVGTDHMPPVRDLPACIPSDADLGTLDEYLARAPKRQTAEPWRGELRSAARANLLPNVVSARIDIKAACARAERALERYAEPLQALYGDDWPAAFLDEAWERVLQNAAHDSICGCSADEVSAQVLVRYAEAEQIATTLADRAVARLAARAPIGTFVVVNPSPWPRDDLVELDVVVPDEWPAVALVLPSGDVVATQEVRRSEPLLWAGRVAGADVEEWLRRRLHGRELFRRTLNGYRAADGVLTIEVGDEADPESLDAAALVREAALATATGEWTVRVEARAKRTVVAIVRVPALGYTTVQPVRADDDGAEPVDDTPPVLRIVRGRDEGDSYNYAPPEDDVLVDTPDSERVETLESGPVRSVVRRQRLYTWDRRRVDVAARFERRAREPFVRVELTVDNACDDQRVRVHVPLGAPAATTRAEGQFAVVERPPRPEGGYGEEPVGTYPASAFVAAGNVALLLDHVTEYELLEGELALTALRSTGLISRSVHRWREDPAGPELPIPAAQMRGRQRFAFAICSDAEHALVHAESYRLPFLFARGSSRDGEVREAAGLEIERAMLSALRRRGGELEARVVNQTATAVTARVRGTEVELGPWELRAVALPG